MSVSRRVVPVNGVELVVYEAGPVGAPLVVLCHGFPEGSYSWRHQMEPLAEAGYRVIAPDQRGYGHSSCPAEVADYRLDRLHGDLLALVAEQGYDQAVYVGHDWGSLIVWEMARCHPEAVRAVVGCSVPFTQWPMRPTELLEMVMGDRFFYMLYFQEVGPAERELGADPRETIRKLLWGASAWGHRTEMAELRPAEGTGFLDGLQDVPAGSPPWITEAELDHFGAEFSACGFFGPVSWYRNLDANFDLVGDTPASNVTMPAYFIGGAKDMVVTMNMGAVDSMPTTLPGFRRSVLLPDVGHWTPQEDPVAFNEALLAMLAEL